MGMGERREMGRGGKQEGKVGMVERQERGRGWSGKWESRK